MNRNNRQRTVYVTARQKKKLLEFITKYPELKTGRTTENFSYSDSQKLWITIANECNAIPGAKKTWRQWRKTWQDLKSKTKKRYAERNGEYSPSVVLLTQAEQEALGLKVSTSNLGENPEFVNSGSLDQDHTHQTFNNVDESNSSSNEALESPTEEKVFTNSVEDSVSYVINEKGDSANNKHSSNCAFNCNLLAMQEKRKIDIKEDYLKFKKDYLRQKLKLFKEQTEALKSIAKELSSK